MRRLRLGLLVPLAVLLLVGCGSDNSTPTPANTGAATTPPLEGFSVAITAQNGSGINGAATFNATADDQVEATINVQGPAGSYPAHVHKGTCADLDPTPAYAFPNVENGTATQVLPVSLAELESAPYAVNLHQSNDDLETYVACGDLPSAAGAGGGATTTEDEMGTTTEDGY